MLFSVPALGKADARRSGQTHDVRSGIEFKNMSIGSFCVLLNPKCHRRETTHVFINV